MVALNVMTGKLREDVPFSSFGGSGWVNKSRVPENQIERLYTIFTYIVKWIRLDHTTDAFHKQWEKEEEAASVLMAGSREVAAAFTHQH